MNRTAPLILFRISLYAFNTHIYLNAKKLSLQVVGFVFKLIHVLSINAPQMQVASAIQKKINVAPTSMCIHRQKVRADVKPHALCIVMDILPNGL
jgi:hypothetical protein